MQSVPWNLIFLAVLLGASGIGWVLRQLRDQASRRQAQAEAQRRQEERLRTGRDPVTGEVVASASQPMRESEVDSQAVAEQRLRELAARRQEQLRELRRQRGAAAPTGSAGGAGGGGGGMAGAGGGQPVRREMWPGGPVVVIGAPAPAAPSAPAGSAGEAVGGGAGARTPKAGKSRRSDESRRRSGSGQSGGGRGGTPVRGGEGGRRLSADSAVNTMDLSRRAMAVDLAGAEKARAVAAVEASRRLERERVATGLPRTPADWRRALVASEILGTPVAMRSGDERQF